MRRIVSIWLPNWQTDRIRQISPESAPPGQPIALRAHDGRRMIVAAADPLARALGVQPAMALAHAQAIVPGLIVLLAAPADDAVALAALAGDCLRWSPMSCACEPDGIWIDTTGCDHLHGGEAAMLAAMQQAMLGQGYEARLAIADTAGAAHALARQTGDTPTVVLPAGQQMQRLAPLPVSALRLAPDVSIGLRRLGLETIGDLARTPRGPLVRRFGKAVMQRLDQAYGRLAEPIAYMVPPDLVQRRQVFLEPLLTADALAHVAGLLTAHVCVRLEAEGKGARRLDLLFERIDNTVQAIRIGTARATRDARHLTRLLCERLDRVEPGFGIEAMQLTVSLTDPLRYSQTGHALSDGLDENGDTSALVDRLANRFGASKIYRISLVESELPERCFKRIGAETRQGADPGSPRRYARPVRLLAKPQPVGVVLDDPHRPPVRFTCFGRLHPVRRADGPERLYGEWWRGDAERDDVRDYWLIEDEQGQRFWLFRRGDGVDTRTGDGRWFLHGFFA